MPFSDRSSIYSKISKIRGNPLITYVTSLRPNAIGQIAPDVISEFARQILSVPRKNKTIDLLLISNGGDPTVAWRIMNFLRERFEIINVLLPYTAYSAATLIAMGADTIVMHPFSNLGPVDPQITSPKPNETKPLINHFGSEDLINYLAFVRDDFGITNQAELSSSFELLVKDVGAIPVGAAKRSAQLSISLGEKLLSMHMNDRNEAHLIAESLSKSFYHHGYPVGRSEAKEIGLSIEEPDEEIEELMWSVWLDFEKEMECNTPFNPLKLVFQDVASANRLNSSSQIQIPVNLPPNLAQQAYNQILNQITVVSSNALDYEIFYASVESIFCRSEFRTKGKINATRMPDMNIAVSITPIIQEWKHYEN